MGLRESRFLTLKEIEGPLSSHDGYVKRELSLRKGPLKYVRDPEGLARYIGGRVEQLGLKEDWAISKEVFPGGKIILFYYREDEEFPSRFGVLYSGERVREVSGIDLVGLTIKCANHMLRWVRETCVGEELPEVCWEHSPV